MATLPYFVFSPNSVISLIGLLRGPDPTVPTPSEDWRTATVDVIIPALNEERTIAACLASVARQTLRPRRVMLIDDGSRDRTIEIAEAFARQEGLNLTVIRRAKPIGKTPTIKRQALELDSDVEFILDGDTILESDTYIARTVEELYKAIGIASACGTIMPLRLRDRAKFDAQPSLARFTAERPEAQLMTHKPLVRRAANAITNLYREVLYLFLQRFVYLGQMVAFGSITNPVGCAVAYRRRYIKDLFEKYHADLRRRSHELGRHLHRVRASQRGVSQHPAHRRVHADRRARGAAPSPAVVSVVVVVPAVLLLLRQSGPLRTARCDGEAAWTISAPALVGWNESSGGAVERAGAVDGTRGRTSRARIRVCWRGRRRPRPDRSSERARETLVACRTPCCGGGCWRTGDSS